MKHNLNIVWVNNEAPEGNRYYVFSITIIINEIEAPEGIDTTYLDTRDKKHLTKEGAVPLNIYITKTKTTIKSQNRKTKILNFFYPQT